MALGVAVYFIGTWLNWPLPSFNFENRLRGFHNRGTAVSDVRVAKVADHPEKERFTESMPDPVRFPGGFKSYQSVRAVRQTLDAAEVKYTVTPLRTPPSEKYPPGDRDTLVAPAYQHLDVTGELTLEFFNDRLYEFKFVPSDPVAYVGVLRAYDARLTPDHNGRVVQTAGDLQLFSNVHFATSEVGQKLRSKPIAIWQDLRLKALRDEWDRRFVALSVPAAQ